VVYREGIHGEGLLKEAANADKMKEDGRFWAEQTRGEAMEEEARQARVGVEDVFDVEDLDGRRGGSPSRRLTT
jgi:hypothetical protein